VFPHKAQVVKSDTDGFYYLREDVQWVVEPTSADPGVIEPKPGAIPRDSFGRTLDEPTIDDETLSQMPTSSARP